MYSGLLFWSWWSEYKMAVSVLICLIAHRQWVRFEDGRLTRARAYSILTCFVIIIIIIIICVSESISFYHLVGASRVNCAVD
jgi:hypothetical protein